jgi:hypothetical protein
VRLDAIVVRVWPRHGQDFPLEIEGLVEEPCLFFAGRHGVPCCGGRMGQRFLGHWLGRFTSFQERSLRGVRLRFSLRGQGLYVVTVANFCGGKKAPAIFLFPTAFTLRDVLVFPIADGLPSEWP